MVQGMESLHGCSASPVSPAWMDLPRWRLQGLSQQSPRALPSSSLLALSTEVPTEPQGLAAVCANFTESRDG